jgi:hypothetical protein
LDRLRANLYNTSTNADFNYQFIIDAFAPDSTKVDTATGAVWDIGFGHAKIENTIFTFLDSINNIYLNTVLPSIELEVEKFDLINQTFAIKKLNLEKAKVDISTLIADDGDTSDISITPELIFPYTGWDLAADQLTIIDSDIRYWVENVAIKEKVFDANHLHLQQLNVELADFLWDVTQLETKIKTLNFKDQSGFAINKAITNLRLSPNEIVVQDFLLQTPTSTISNNTLLVFKSWNALPDFINQVEFSSQFDNSKLSIYDLELFVPYIPNEYRVNESLFVGGTVKGKNGKLQLQQLDFKLGNILVFKASGAVANVTDPNRLTLKLELKKMEVDYQKLRTVLPILSLPPTADSLGQISLIGQFEGSLANMEIKNLFLNTSANTLLKASGKIQNLTKVQSLSYDLNIENLQTKASDLAYFSTTPLPNGLYEMQLINYKGLLKGNLTDITTKGKLSTAIGTLGTDLAINFNKAYSNASYEGSVLLSNFDLGLFLGDTTMYGLASLEATIDGQGISPDSLDTQIEATVQSITFNRYD